MKVLKQGFYKQDAEAVAKGLLGTYLVKKENCSVLKGVIVETEAYFGENDPASKAYGGRVTRLNSWMWKPGGIIFVYMVHGYWLFNIITGGENKPEGVLIRALEPIKGIKKMKRRRKVKKLERCTSGPGCLTEAFRINDKYRGIKIFDSAAPISILDSDSLKKNFDIESSHRIGVTGDLSKELRFFIKGNNFVSK